ncbi:chalcone isomerase family protein [Thalassotalea atypica]|uniref:chalcone isomerase family protein n=1 Tax=Thalassotalea atypica TaxID=2054316 RepID=UPI0025744469|nr:chalcone isomerase family protein [Thalassotalea atypica]
MAFVSRTLRHSIFTLALMFVPQEVQACKRFETSLVPCNLSDIIESSKLLPMGKAMFTVLFWDIYESKLYTSSGRYPIDIVNEQLLFEIKYLTDISNEELIRRTIEQWQYIGFIDVHYQKFIPELKRLWPDITDGDSLSLLINNNRSYFYFNRDYLGEIQSSMFGQMFIDIWLSERTSQPRLRKQLMGEIYNE